VLAAREHPARQALYVESMAVIGREIGLHFALRGPYARTSAAAYRRKAQAVEAYLSRTRISM
jgi:hypothetical protein